MPDTPEPPLPAGVRTGAVMGSLLALTFLAKLAFACAFEGFMTGDDLEIVQIAAKYAAGVRYQPWDLRCLFHPLVLVFPVMKVAVAGGVRDPALLTVASALPTIAFSTIAIALVFLLARRVGASPRTALVAAFLYALHPMSLIYGSSPFPRPISTALIVAAFLLASAPKPLARRLLAAGGLVGMAFAVRWSEGVALLPLVGWRIWRDRSFRNAGAIVAGFSAGAFLFAGVVDRLTWGSFFSSLKRYFVEMYFEASPIRMAEEDPFPQYFRAILHWGGPLLVLLVLYAAWKDRRARGPALIALSLVLLMSCFAHKEWRYVQVAIPFLAIAAAFGWERLAEGRLSLLATIALILVVPYGIERSITRLNERSGSGIQAARFINGLRPRARVLALEQMWAYGEHLYLGNDVEIQEIEFNDPFRPLAIRLAARGADVLGVYTLHLDRAAMLEIARLGFRRLKTFRTHTAYECAVYGRVER